MNDLELLQAAINNLLAVRSFRIEVDWLTEGEHVFFTSDNDYEHQIAEITMRQGESVLYFIRNNDGVFVSEDGRQSYTSTDYPISMLMSNFLAPIARFRGDEVDAKQVYSPVIASDKVGDIAAHHLLGSIPDSETKYDFWVTEGEQPIILRILTVSPREGITNVRFSRFNEALNIAPPKNVKAA